MNEYEIYWLKEQVQTQEETIQRLEASIETLAKEVVCLSKTVAALMDELKADKESLHEWIVKGMQKEVEED